MISQIDRAEFSRKFGKTGAGVMFATRRHDNNHVDFKLIPMGEIEKVCGHFVCCLGLDVAHARATPVPLALGSPVLLFLPVYGL